MKGHEHKVVGLIYHISARCTTQNSHIGPLRVVQNLINTNQICNTIKFDVLDSIKSSELKYKVSSIRYKAQLN